MCFNNLSVNIFIKFSIKYVFITSKIFTVEAFNAVYYKKIKINHKWGVFVLFYLNSKVLVFF